MARKIKNEEIIDGKEIVKVVENIHGGKANVRSIDELLGLTKNPYSVGTVEEYTDKVNAMTLADLQSHASKLGVPLVNNKPRLVTRLVAEYKRVSRGYHNFSQHNTIEPKNSAAVLNILRAGK